MNKDIQPKVNTSTQVSCACGNSFTTISTEDVIKVEICSACHPFYTGQQKFVDTEGRIDKFKKKQQLAEEKKQKAESTKKTKVEEKTQETNRQPTLKEMLEQARKSS